MRKACYDSPNPATRKIMYWYCSETGKCYDSALAGSIVYDPPETAKPCPKNFKSANGGKVCIWENENLKSNTPILDSLEGSTSFPAPKYPINKRPNRLDRQTELTELLGGPF
jgi:hypothetical protein